MNILHGQLTVVVRGRVAAQININLSKRSTGARPRPSRRAATYERASRATSIFIFSSFFGKK